MPKMKTHRGAAKRIRITGSGKVMRKKDQAKVLTTLLAI